MTTNQNDEVFVEMPGIHQNTLVPKIIDRPLAITGMSVLQYNLSDLLGIFTFKEVITYTAASDTPHQFDVDPWAIAMLIYPNLHRIHPYLRADVEFQLRVTSQFQQVGALIVTLFQQPIDGVGFGGSSRALIAKPDILFEHPHEIINLGEDSTTTIKCPWNSAFQCLRSDKSYVQQQIQIEVLDKIKTSVGVTPISRMHVYYRLTNVQLVGYNNWL